MSNVSEAERALRIELAGLYRVFDHLGWTELIYNHISAHLPGTEHFLINPYGLHYREVTASNLVKIDLEGAVIGQSAHGVNPAGFVIHSAVHAARPDAVFVAHTHTTAGMAVACQEGGLRGDNFYSCLVVDAVAYHDFEGITVRTEERARLVQNLGDDSLMILRNHGLMACGESAAACFANLWILQRACEIQMATDAGRGAPIPIGAGVRAASAKGVEVMMAQAGYGKLELAALMRRMDELDPSYRD